MTYDKESIRRLLRVAFEDARGLDIATPSHEDCIYFRSRLIAIRHEKLRFFLAHVLEDLLDSHTGIEFDSQDAEAVVQDTWMFLTVLSIKFASRNVSGATRQPNILKMENICDRKN